MPHKFDYFSTYFSVALAFIEAIMIIMQSLHSFIFDAANFSTASRTEEDSLACRQAKRPRPETKCQCGGSMRIENIPTQHQDDNVENYDFLTIV